MKLIQEKEYWIGMEEKMPGAEQTNQRTRTLDSY